MGGAFWGCASLSHIDIPESVTSLPSNCFRGSGLREIMIHKNIELIGDFAFDDTPIENFLVEEENLYYTADGGILYDKEKQTLIKYPRGRNEESFLLPPDVCHLASGAFRCATFHSLYLHASLQSVGNYALAKCTNLTELHLCAEDPNVFVLSANAFTGFNFAACTLFVPVGTGYAYRHHPVFCKFKEVVIERNF